MEHQKKTASLILVLLLSALSDMYSPAAEVPTCDICGMYVDSKAPFSTQIVGDTENLHFCDIGDLFLHLSEHPDRLEHARVKDYLTREWVPARQALYVHSPRRFTTPMGWSIAAFADRASAEEYGIPEDVRAAMRRISK